MSDVSNGAKADRPLKKKAAGQGWNASADGRNVSKTFALGSTAAAGKLAKRALQMAEKNGQPVELRLAGTSVTVGLAAAGGFVGDPERRMIKRLEGKLSAEAKAPAAKPEKPAKAAKPAAAAPAKAAKAAKPAKGAKTSKASQATKSAKPATKPASKPGSKA